MVLHRNHDTLGLMIIEISATEAFEFPLHKVTHLDV